VSVEPALVRVNGPKGELTERIPRDITVAQEGEELIVKRPTDRGEHRALHGLTRSLVANMVEGVTDGYTRTLEIHGVGYRAQLKGKGLELSLGFSHPVSIPAPDGIEFEVPQPTRVIVKGISKQQVGEIAATIRKQRRPEPYKGKGIRYEGEHVPRKVGKRA
jgi:large subunit ribosomal protein L6